MMPGMDGLAILSILQRLKPDLRAIAMSGIYSTETVTQAEKQGFRRFLPKPFTTKDLLKSIRSET